MLHKYNEMASTNKIWRCSYNIPYFCLMADVHSKETRSYNMSRIRSKDTRPELLVRRFFDEIDRYNFLLLLLTYDVTRNYNAKESQFYHAPA
jgi:hypothetical protein